jgi:ribA/ribD-fused uncharacterized protein
MDGLPPKFAPFKKTKVVLRIEATPSPSDQHTDLTAIVSQRFTPGGQVEVILGDETQEQSEADQMFVNKKTKKPKEARGAIETLLRSKVTPGQKKVHVRHNISSREDQATKLETISKEEVLKKGADDILKVESTDPYKLQTETFVPMTRRGFGTFIRNKFRPIFPTEQQRKLDVATCKGKGEQGKKEVSMYHYQEFIREYMRYETPYRGLLVYHGLGSGKTCSAIAAAEALYGTHGMKLIIMTPFSLRDNFISEISFCGFKHFRLDNNWISLSLLPGSKPEPELVKLFAKTIYKMPDSFFAPKGRSRVTVSRIWIPDFEKNPGSTPFESLNEKDREEIQTQLKQTIENRIEFISYNGILKRDLKEKICSTPDCFDNSVIVIDEIHNLTRLIQGTLERPFTKATPREMLTPTRTPLPKCSTTEDYERGYLFYRLLMDAKNCKIIGLSGTPLINFPEELGILANILHGPLHVLECNIAVNSQLGVTGMQEKIEELVRLHEDFDTVFFLSSEGTITVTITLLPEQFTKILDVTSKQVLGIQRRDPTTSIPSFDEKWTRFKSSLQANKLRVLGTPTFKAQELLPSWDTPFRGAFLEADGITLRNDKVLKKRLRGLVSHYRGIQGNVMPTVTKDVYVGIPLKGYALSIYNKLRNQEIQIELSKPKAQLAAADAFWKEVEEISNMASSSNYRMSSRQACNFVFPEGIDRPRPRSNKDKDVETGKDRDAILGGELENGTPGREEQKEDEEELKGGGGGAVSEISEAERYKREIRAVKKRLYEVKDTHLRLDGPSEHNLQKYSPKFAAMLQNINELAGSSLVYSSFLEMEGIGIFGMCMEANDYVRIEIVMGTDGKPRFTETSRISIEKGTTVKENRYIEFTGVGEKELRTAAVNFFNCRTDKLSSSMAEVLEKGGWKNNNAGELCRVFCITSAGAEGLSLKAVRGVHIMEPYWNTVRTQQVKGRAVRICSHMDLEESEQNVSIYTYCTTIPEEAIAAQAVNKTLENSDSQTAADLIELGVPVPEIGVASEADFVKVDQTVAPVEEGSQGSLVGPVEYHYKLANQYRSFSNFAPSFMVIDGKQYKTVENYFQSMKFKGKDLEDTIRVATDPTIARQLAMDAEKQTPLEPTWKETKGKEYLLQGLREKFKQNRALLTLLKSTGTRPLVDKSSDSFWGTGRTGSGQNLSGKLLETVRLELKNYEVPEGIQDQKLPEESDFADFAESPDKEAPKPTVVAPVKKDERSLVITSDQKVLMISLRKEKVIGALQKIMKSVSVDCELNKFDNGSEIPCVNLGDSIGSFAYHPDLQKDIKETESRFKSVIMDESSAVPKKAAGELLGGGGGGGELLGGGGGGGELLGGGGTY